jgi:hypothetical protein
MTPGPTLGFGALLSAGAAWRSGRRAGWPSGGLVVPTWIQGELAEEFAGGGVDDADVQILDEQQDAGTSVGAADADVVEPAAWRR